MPDFPTPIEHVVVLMFENRSFDHMFGYRYDWPDGLLHAPMDELANIDPVTGIAHPPDDKASWYDLVVDPGHSPEDVDVQLHGGPRRSVPVNATNLGFVQNYREQDPSAPDPERIMRCFAPGRFAAFSTLADNFTVCSAWYSSVPGPTWPNRFFLHAGTSRGFADSFTKLEIISRRFAGFAFRESVFTALERAGPTWKVYEHHYSQSRFLRPKHAPNSPRPRGSNQFVKFHQFTRDVQQGRLANYSFIEPDWKGKDQNDMHPHSGSDVRLADKLVADVYNVLRASPDWKKILLIILFDEHGGTYDHQYPPLTDVPDESKPWNPLVPFDQLGLRVPAILVSHYSPKGLSRTTFDHTSVAASLFDLFGLGPVLPSLGHRARQSRSVRDELQFDPAAEKPDRIDHTPLANLRYVPSAPLDQNQRLLVAMIAVEEETRRIGLIGHRRGLMQPDSAAVVSRQAIARARASATVDAIQTVQDLEAYLAMVTPEAWDEEKSE